jgi:hypothetical protein
MSLIDGVGRPGLPWAGRGAGASKAGFSVPSSVAAGTAGAADAAPVRAAALAGMLTLQERSKETVEDRQARRRGQDLLRALSRMQRALLEDGPDQDSLQTLAGLIADLPHATDPGLHRVLQAIALRARVELAREGL